MSAPPYMKLYWADYHQDTRHLTRDEHGAYFLLLGEAWNRDGYLPDDDALLARWTLSTAEEWQRLRPVISAFFRPASKGRWRHKRIGEELAAYSDVSRKRKAAGKRGGASRRGKDEENPEANAVAIAKQKPTKPEPEPEPYSVDKSTAGLLSSGDHNRDAWTVAMSVLTDQGGLAEPQARMFFGRLLSENGITAAALLPSVVSAMTNGTRDPQAYLTKAARGVATRAAPRQQKRVGFV